MKNLALALSVLFLMEPAFAKDGRFRCRANGADGREAELRFERGEMRAKWEIDDDAGQEVGDLVRVTVAGRFIGNIVLDELDGGELEGDEFFNSGLPQVRSGTKATVGSLACTFRAD